MSYRRYPWHHFRVFWALRLLRRGYLGDVGWFTSACDGSSVNAKGIPLPWISYPCIDFLTPRIQAQWTVFEYGCGNSTRWWSSRVARIRSCEHEQTWFDKVQPTLPSNCELVYRPLDASAAYEHCLLEKEDRYDVVVIDGRHRVACSEVAVQRLTDAGVILWDNTDREKYHVGMQALRTAGFRQIDFWGMSPITVFRSCTTIFYRTGNCLGI